jgi:hypothetical protein
VQPISQTGQLSIMTRGQVVFYDYKHCHEFLAANADQVVTSAGGLGALAPYRPLYSAFTHEALETSAITLGQFDAGLVYMFVPQDVRRAVSPAAHKVARAKALELLGCSHPPMVFEIHAAKAMEPPLADPARYDNWMDPDLLAIVDEGALEIHLVINGHAFFEDILTPALKQNGFSTPDDYLSAAKSGFVRTRHPGAPGKVYKLPWVKWIREMLTGGFSMAWPMACLGTYLQKMQQSISAS